MIESVVKAAEALVSELIEMDEIGAIELSNWKTAKTLIHEIQKRDGASTYTEDDIGKLVTVVIEDVTIQDEVIEMFLPNGSVIIGPSITCGHLFARAIMIPDMIRISDDIKTQLEDSL